MTEKEVIKQLKDLLDYCKSSGEEWKKDADALEIAIFIIEQSLQASNIKEVR